MSAGCATNCTGRRGVAETREGTRQLHNTNGVAGTVEDPGENRSLPSRSAIGPWRTERSSRFLAPKTDTKMIKLHLAARGRAQQRRYVRTTVAFPKKNITLGETCAAPEEQKYVSMNAGLGKTQWLQILHPGSGRRLYARCSRLCWVVYWS